MSCCDQPNPRPHLYTKSGMGFFGGKGRGCCCSPVVHAWGGVILIRETGSSANPFAIPWPGDANFTGFPRASEASAEPVAWRAKRWRPQFNGSIAHGACYQGRVETDDNDPANAENPAASFSTVGLNVEWPIEPATFDVRPRTAVLCQLPWKKFSQDGYGGFFSDSTGLSVALGLTEGGVVYGWGNLWPLPRYNEHWGSAYIDGQAFAPPASSGSEAKSVAERTWLSPIALDFKVGTGVYIDVDIIRGSTVNFIFSKIALVDTNGDVHVGFYAPGQGEYEIQWSTHSLDAKSAMVISPSSVVGQYRVAAVCTDGSIRELRFDATTDAFIETVTHSQAQFASLFGANRPLRLNGRLMYGALTQSGEIYIFFGGVVVSGQTNLVRQFGVGRSFVSAGFDEISGVGFAQNFVYGLDVSGRTLAFDLMGSGSVISGELVPFPQHPNRKFVKAAFAGLSPTQSVFDPFPYRLFNRISILYIAADGTLWAYGENRVYQLGDGTRTNRDYYVQISRHKWKDVSFGKGSTWFEPEAGNPNGIARSANVAFAIFDDYSDDKTFYFSGDALDGNWSNLDNWRLRRLPSAVDAVVAERSITTNTLNRPTSVANFTQAGGSLGIAITVGGDAVFSTGALGATGIVTGNAVFQGSSTSSGRINGNAVFNDSSRNNSTGIVTGNAVFNENSRNLGTVGTGPSNTHQFNGAACNSGTVNGTVAVDGNPAESAPTC